VIHATSGVETALNRGARAGREVEGDEAEGGDGDGHHDGAEPLEGPLDRGLPLRDARLAQFADVAVENHAIEDSDAPRAMNPSCPK